MIGPSRRTVLAGGLAIIGTFAMSDDLSSDSLARLDMLRATIGAGLRQLTGVVDLDAAPDRVFTAITEIDEMRGWMDGLEGGTYEARTSNAPITPGMTRRLSFSKVDDVERIVLSEPPNRFAYAITGGMPIRDHLAVMEVEPIADGCRLTWHQCFSANLFTRPLRRRGVGGFVTRSLTALSAQMGGSAPRLC